MAKNNNELLANLGNFSNRCLKFLKSQFGGVVPSADPTEEDKPFLNNLVQIIGEYEKAMEAVKIKDSLRIAMEYS